MHDWGFPTIPTPADELREECRRDEQAEREERERLKELYGAHAFRSRRAHRKGR